MDPSPNPLMTKNDLVLKLENPAATTHTTLLDLSAEVIVEILTHL
jgi:hypothetical protein